MHHLDLDSAEAIFTRLSNYLSRVCYLQPGSFLPAGTFSRALEDSRWLHCAFRALHTQDEITKGNEPLARKAETIREAPARSAALRELLRLFLVYYLRDRNRQRASILDRRLIDTLEGVGVQQPAYSVCQCGKIFKRSNPQHKTCSKGCRQVRSIKIPANIKRPVLVRPEQTRRFDPATTTGKLVLEFECPGCGEVWMEERAGTRWLCDKCRTGAARKRRHDQRE